jgi:hypothetical protein
MAYPQFVDAVCLTAMTIYHHPRYKEQGKQGDSGHVTAAVLAHPSMLILSTLFCALVGMSVEDMMETFFSQLCSLKRAR